MMAFFFDGAGSALVAVAANSPFYAFSLSDAFGKGIVLLLLFGSVLTWTIMIDKGMVLAKATRRSRAFKDVFREAKHTLSAFTRAEANRGPLAEIYLKAARETLGFYGISPETLRHIGSASVREQRLSTVQIEAIRGVLDQAIADKILELEDNMGLLGTAVSVSPLLGLFGTVWGVMIAFCGMAVAKRPDIAAMAPGIASSLLTTVVGLVVAMPSLVGYNFLSNNILKLTVAMDNFAEEFMSKMKLDQLELTENEAAKAAEEERNRSDERRYEQPPVAVSPAYVAYVPPPAPAYAAYAPPPPAAAPYAYQQQPAPPPPQQAPPPVSPPPPPQEYYQPRAAADRESPRETFKLEAENSWRPPAAERAEAPREERSVYSRYDRSDAPRGDREG